MAEEGSLEVSAGHVLGNFTVNQNFFREVPGQ
jgi:hypothetical protein